ncbi:esterase-like activity of phytase family protein [Devosia sp. XJ19-1]|uniref:Esterase-like activity of phytase family protein n=1 Tax=Devosia ureilytica TaxID=2952754 RepID=A0A9Q4AP91_9HYPH|nr:esterase-like activity of phytase family protein [Devosia ureilytica]MCP8883623.1 esterase-like activity of phytase family protein [Devosia ureilytica]MCP8887231.1 esterase-like activity of phytase family protein [Devosia ureilytica]
MTAHKRLAVLSAALLLSTAGVQAAPYFNRIANFPVALNTPDAEETSAEIITVSEDGMTLIYSDSPAGGIGFVDITDPTLPKAKGFLALEGEPTTVVVDGGKVFAGVNTSESFTAPSGNLSMIDLASQAVEASCDLGGQPDSVARSADGALIAVAIENERDEDLNDGEIPQMPAGALALLNVTDGVVDCDSLKLVDLTGLAEIAGDDPEPEYVSINSQHEVVVSLQENNHFVIVDGEKGEVTAHFSAGSVDLEGIDTEDNGSLDFTGSQSERLREPDAVKWIDDERFVVANEGDYNGGSRSFSIFSKSGEMLYDSGAALDHLAAQFGHYPDKRSDAKGVEPEGVDVATFGEDTYLLIGLERASLVAVYKDTGAEAEFVQALPSGIGPEGAVAIPSRNLLVTANETDLGADGAARSHVSIFELADAEAPAYPHIISDLDADGRPLGWVALSGLAADADKPGMLYGVSDSFLGNQPSIYTIDATAQPARITTKTIVTRNGDPAQKLDLEGIALDGEGGFWLASEGRTDRLIPHALYRVKADGKIAKEVPFPAELLAEEIRFGAEGITMVGEGEDATLWIAMQREWQNDAKGMVKLVSYKPATGEWGAVNYPLEAPAEGAWVGLSEITAHGDLVYIVERDNQIGEKAQLKALYSVPVSELVPGALGGELPTVTKTLVRDFIPDLTATGGYVLDKVEGFAIDAAGTGFAVTDNDGVDDSSGETMFWSFNL